MVKTLLYEGEVLSKVFIADTFFKRLLGYMFRKRPHHEAIGFNPCNSIHTFFMNFPIDVLFIDSNMKVVKKIEALSAGKLIMPIKGVKMIIEGKEGLFQKVKLGSKVEVIK